MCFGSQFLINLVEGFLDMTDIGQIERALEGGTMKQLRTVSNIIRKRRMFCVSPDDMARQACKVMTNRKVGALPVLDDTGTLVGVISERDIVRRCIGVKRKTANTAIRDVMTPDPLVAKADDSIVVAIAVMMQNNIRHLPVLENGVVIGMISIREVVSELSTLAVQNLGLTTLAGQTKMELA